MTGTKSQSSSVEDQPLWFDEWHGYSPSTKNAPSRHGAHLLSVERERDLGG
jgi:hypothetical protein